MPIYEYMCGNGHVFEIINVAQREVHPVVACPDCGEHASRQITAANWQLGSGPKESNISRAIGRVRKAEREGRLD